MEPEIARAWLDVLAAGLSLGLATFAFVTSKGRAANRWLGFVLVLNAVNNLRSVQAWISDPGMAAEVDYYGYVALLPLVPVYLAFVATAVDTPATRPLRRPSVIGGLTTVAAILAGIGLFWHDAVVDPATGTATAFSHGVGVAAIAVNLFALVCGVYGYVVAPAGTITKHRALLYALAFGIYELSVVIDYAAITTGATTVVAAMDLVGNSALQLAAYALIVFAMLRYQLLDVELKVKLSIQRGTIAGTFLAVFFIATQVAQNYLQQYGILAGGAAAGLLIFALRPIERAAASVAEAAMPKVDGSVAYAQYKKFEVYRAAVESALEGGSDIDPRERGVLDRLRAKLALAPEDAAALEKDAREAFATA